MKLRSSISETVWPAIVTGEGAALLAMAFQLEQSQWWPAHQIDAHQRLQLALLLRHARRTVPWYAERLGRGSREEEAVTPEAWRTIPLLTKQDIRQHQADLRSRRIPLAHGELHRNKTSGSTGEPLEVTCTEMTGFFWQSLVVRDDLWHRRDPEGRLVAIRSGRYAPDPLAVVDLPGAGRMSPLITQTGPVTLFYHAQPIPRQVELLEARSPNHLLVYPSNARALCRYALRRPLRLPALRSVQTYGEPLPPDVRAACREAWGVPVEDVYSCEELGFIALQCPLHEHYHVQSESVLVEVLDEAGLPVRPGEIGRVVLTSLHNFAMPLIRYAIGDYAEVGGPCPCGRGLPVLTRILGRRRNQVTLPDGRRAWPDVGALWAAIPEVDRIQVVQRGPEEVEVRFERATPLSAAEERLAAERVQEALDHPFRLTFTGPAPIPRQPNGKYETFVDAR